MPRTALALLLLLTTGCWSIDTIDLDKVSEKTGLELTHDNAPRDAKPIASLSVYKTGFYLFGIAPVVSATLEDAVDRFVAKARKLEADGISDIEYEFVPPSPTRFLVFPVPDWSATVWLHGMAYERPGVETAADAVRAREAREREEARRRRAARPGS